MENLAQKKRSRINNQFYDTLQERWYTATDDPVALLRAESKFRNPWIVHLIRENFSGQNAPSILDLGCGAGFLSNFLAKEGLNVTGVDLSEESLAVAKAHDLTKKVQYEKMDAKNLAFKDKEFDVVCAMDFLEHVAEKEEVISEVSRVLRPGGFFFFHTFNKTWVSHFIVIKGVEWFVKNTPKHMHVPELFISPKDLEKICSQNQLVVFQIQGIRPQIWNRAFWNLIFSGRVDQEFKFVRTRSLATGYMGVSKKLPKSVAES